MLENKKTLTYRYVDLRSNSIPECDTHFYVH